MARHSKNNTAGSVFTYHERQLMGSGTQKVRLAACSIKPVRLLFPLLPSRPLVDVLVLSFILSFDLCPFDLSLSLSLFRFFPPPPPLSCTDSTPMASDLLLVGINDLAFLIRHRSEALQSVRL